MKHAAEEALRKLLTRTNDDAFVIFHRASGEDYVQFARDNQGLFLDLPVIPLDDLQQMRAKQFFAEFGVSLDDTQLTAHDGSPAGSMQFYRVDFGQDVQRAAATALDVFREVYALQDFEIEIEEN
ncbi:MAG: hypothetical protein AAF735_03950 [Myxococcota bacterium]